jgi:hypothetical protein
MMDPFRNWNRDKGTCHGQMYMSWTKLTLPIQAILEMTHKIDKAFAQEGM